MPLKSRRSDQSQVSSVYCSMEAPRTAGIKRKIGDIERPLYEENPAWSLKGKSKDSQLQFACPYYKNDPAKHEHVRRCHDQAWPNVARLKEHLYKCHRQVLHCPKCLVAFSEQDEYHFHLRERMGEQPLCELREGPPTEWFGSEQEEELRKRKELPNVTEEEEWRKVYHILFPCVAEDRIPSPYYEPMPDGSADILSSMTHNLRSLARKGSEGIFATIGQDTTMKDLRGSVDQASSKIYNIQSLERQPALPKGDDNQPASKDDLPSIFQNDSVLLQAESGALCSPASEANNVLGDKLDALPSLEADANIGGLWIASLNRATFYHAKYKECGRRGSYIRADSMEHFGIEGEKDGFLAIQRDRGLSSNVDNNAALLIACRVVNVKDARQIGMDVDLILGTDYMEGLEHQQFGGHILRVASQRLADIIEEEQPPPSICLRQEEGRIEPSNLYTRSDMDTNTQVEHEISRLPNGKQYDDPYTDSGYGSVQSFDYPSILENDPKKAFQMECGNSDTTRDTDRDDANTTYSHSSTALPQAAAVKTVIDICNHINQRLTGLFDSRALMLESKKLPTLIKAFAIKLGSDMPVRFNLRIMHFVHMHHQYIVSQLQNKFQCDENDAMDSRRSMDTMPLGEIMSLWNKTQDKDSATVDPSELFQGVEDEEDLLNGEDRQDIISEEGDEFSFPGLGNSIVKSAAYEWLISSLTKEVSFHWDETEPRMVDQIRQEILSRLPTGQISSRRPPDPHTVSFKIPKSSLPFLFEDRRSQSAMRSPTMIADRIVVTSASAYSVQISKVSQYMSQTWPQGGSTLLSVLQNVVNGTEHDSIFTATEDNSKITIMLGGFYLEALITGTAYSIAEYGEQLAWLTAALQPAVSDSSIYVRPFMRHVDDDALTSGRRHSWFIEIWREGINDADIIAQSVREWQGGSKCPVIVRGFPTMSRPGDYPGIEVPLQLLPSWSPSLSRESTGTRLLLNANGKVLQLFKHNNDVTVWHILSSPREICACRERSLEHNGHDHLPCLDFAELQQYRHIITECSTAKLYDRDTIQRTEPGIGSTEISQRECSLSEAPQRTTRSENDTDSSDSLDEDMLSIPDSSEYGVGGRPITDDATLAAIEEVASRLVIEYGRYTEHNSANEYAGNTKQCSPGGQQSLPTHGSSYSTPGATATQASSTNTSRKRPAEQDDGDGNEDAQRGPPQKKSKKGGPGNTQLNFACPFWKLSPGKHRNCFGKRLGRICRVKQHLVRTHMPEFRCDKCLAVFKDEAHKLAHLRLVQCIFEDKRCGVITTEKRHELSKKPRASLTEPQQWFRVWEILFPGLPRPSSPYLDAEVSEDLNHFREVSERRAPSVFMEVFHDEGLVIPGDSEREALIRRAVSRAIGLLYDRCLTDRNATSQNSNSEGPSSAVPSEYQYNERHNAQAPISTELSSNADSGVELRSQSSSGREDANIPPCSPIRPWPSSNGRVHLGPSGTASLGVHAADPLDSDTNPPQLSLHPLSVDTGNHDFLYQLLQNQTDPVPHNYDFGEDWDAELRNLAENMADDHV